MEQKEKIGELTEIVAIIEALKKASITQLLEKINLPKRTLQRRLTFLIAQEKITVAGKGRARRYAVKQAPVTITKYVYVIEPLSEASQEILRYIKQPLIKRTPVGYQRAFVDAYIPNTTYYLPLSVREHLSKTGVGIVTKEVAGTFARQIYERLLIDLSWNSSRLEGNTYSLLETKQLLESGKSPEGKNSQDTQMILNHKSALSFMVDAADQIDFNNYTILNLHGMLSDNLLGDPHACGRLRIAPVGIGNAVYHPPEIPQLIEELFQKILTLASKIQDPFEQSFFAMVHIPYLQPFLDVNKRVSRLSANIPLIKNNLCPLSFIDIPKEAYIDGTLGVYELNKTELLQDVYVWAYEHSCQRYSVIRQTIGEPDMFRLQHRGLIMHTIYAIVSEAQDQKTALRYIRKQSEALPDTERARFIEIIETELLNLHEGATLRYHISLSQFQRWKNNEYK